MNDYTSASRYIVRNSARCRKCGVEIESKTVHNFVTCPCGSISVDGGREYIRRACKSFDDLEDTSEYR